MIALILLLSFLSSACNSLATKPVPNCSSLLRARQVQDVSHQERGDRFADFDWKLLKEINSVEKGNVVVSPISLKVVLAMLYEGAKGKTAQEIADALDITNTTAKRAITRDRFSTILNSLQTSKDQYKIKIGTHVFIDKRATPKDLFKCKLQQYYSSDLERVDFSDSAEAVKAINTWASNVTEGHIEHLISQAEAHSNTIMLLLNAVYFKGQWVVPFHLNQTRPGTFYLNEQQSVHVQMMNTTDRFAYYNITELDAQLIRLPYLGKKFAMYILLPNSKSGLETLAQTLGPDKPLTSYLANMSVELVNLVLPKFEFDFTISLRSSLEKLGIKSMFTSEADLSDVADTERGNGLVVSSVLQKAGISVTEVGTVAYAATVAELMDKFGGDDELIHVKADHPFMFFIEDELVKTTVFVGKVTNPDKARVVQQNVTPSPVQPSECVGTLCTNDLEDRNQGDQEASTARYNFFDADLLRELGNTERENFVFSPASIKSLLALVVEAAEGSTLTDLQRLLRLPENITEARKVMSSLLTSLQKTTTSKVIIDSVARVFYSKLLTANTMYRNIIKEHYKAEVSFEDFSSPDVATNINNWISRRTGDLIRSLVDPGMLTPDTYTFLASAIYFHGKWNKEFLLRDTKEACFYVNPQKECQLVQMMAKNEDLYYKFDVSVDSHVLQIPYQDERFAMVIVLPRKKDGIKQLNFDAARLSLPGLLQKMDLYEINLKLPRFSIEYNTDLIHILTKMGLSEVFSENAHLPNMVNGKMGRVSAMVHKAKIEVNEKGTKAAAASGAAVVPLMHGLNTINLEVNHPFYYFVVERESQTVLFAGRLSSVESSTANTQQQAVNNAEFLSVSRRPAIRPQQSHQYNPSFTTTRRHQMGF